MNDSLGISQALGFMVCRQQFRNLSAYSAHLTIVDHWHRLEWEQYDLMPFHTQLHQVDEHMQCQGDSSKPLQMNTLQTLVIYCTCALNCVVHNVANLFNRGNPRAMEELLLWLVLPGRLQSS
jgi:hypothetical protein